MASVAAAVGALSPSSSASSASSRNAAKRSGKKAHSSSSSTIISSLEALPLPFLFVSALVAASLAPHAPSHLRRLARLLRRTVDWFLDEFEPWVKWVVLDACLALFVGLAAKKVRGARPLLRAIGWL